MDLGTLAAQRDQLREEKRALEAQVKELDSQLRDNEAEILELMGAQGVTRTGVGPYTMSISEQSVANVQDWDAVNDYIRAHDAFHLYQRRLSNGAYNEILAGGESIPGVEPFTKVSLNFRKSSAKSAA